MDLAPAPCTVSRMAGAITCRTCQHTRTTGKCHMCRRPLCDACAGKGVHQGICGACRVLVGKAAP